jgi:NADH:ubiquinone oxidoreductase subunit 5 (subunit L)/multisubunit Na+/H+ antiporter MnhA subunit
LLISFPFQLFDAGTCGCHKHFPDVYFLGTRGVSSYLLIGFYYTKDTAVAASKKAFIVTRFADLGFLIGILILSFTTGTFDFITLTDPHGAAIFREVASCFSDCQP